VKLTADLQLGPSQRMCGGILYCTVIKYSIYFIVGLRQSGLLQFQPVILEDFPSVPRATGPLKPHGNYM